MEDNLASYISVLQQFETDKLDHSGRKLMDHLLGTYQLLKAWDNAPDICISGLFHSIYGTMYYQVQSASLQERDYIRSIIGEQTEYLVYLFCVCDRSQWLGQMPDQKKFKLLDNRQKTSVTVSMETFSKLAEISMANWLEQIRFLGHFMTLDQLEKKYKAWSNITPFCSKKAVQSFETYFAGQGIGTI